MFGTGALTAARFAACFASEAFCTEVEELGDSEEAETLISGCLIRGLAQEKQQDLAKDLGRSGYLKRVGGDEVWEVGLLEWNLI